MLSWLRAEPPRERRKALTGRRRSGNSNCQTGEFRSFHEPIREHVSLELPFLKTGILLRLRKFYPFWNFFLFKVSLTFGPPEGVSLEPVSGLS